MTQTYIRCSGYAHGYEPITVVVCLADVSVDTAAEYRQHMLDNVPHAYIVMDVFEFDGELEQAVELASDRFRERYGAEERAAELHESITSVLANAEQAIITNGGHSLEPEQFIDVLTQVARHPDYTGQIVSCVRPGETYEMKDGYVTTTVERKGSA